MAEAQEGLTAQESAFFESGGTQTEGLGASDAAPSSTEPAQQQQAAQQAQQQQQTEQHPEGADSRTVPLAALQEERAERKRLRDENAQMQRNQEALIQRILQSQQPQQQPQQAQEQQIQIPDYATDPVGHLRAQNEIMARQMQQMDAYLRGQAQQSQQMTQQQAAQQQALTHLSSDEARFRSTTPDYDAAAQFLQNSRADEYRAMGVTNPMEIQAALQNDTMWMVSQAQQRGQSVAEMAYALAKQRGYKLAPAGGQGQQGAAQQQDNAARLAAVAAGQQQSASLSQAGGAAAAPMSIEKLLAMSDAEFSKATNGMNWQKLNAELSAR